MDYKWFLALASTGASCFLSVTPARSKVPVGNRCLGHASTWMLWWYHCRVYATRTWYRVRTGLGICSHKPQQLWRQFKWACKIYTRCIAYELHQSVYFEVAGNPASEVFNTFLDASWHVQVERAADGDVIHWPCMLTGSYYNVEKRRRRLAWNARHKCNWAACTQPSDHTSDASRYLICQSQNLLKSRT